MTKSWIEEPTINAQEAVDISHNPLARGTQVYNVYTCVTSFLSPPHQTQEQVNKNFIKTTKKMCNQRFSKYTP